jgi:hypothetical protein
MGNTSAMVNAIEATKTPADVTSLYPTLIGASPFLSATSLQALVAITDESVMPQSLSYQVLASNPEQLRNDTVWQSIQNMANPFDSTYMALLDSNRTALSSLSYLQATVTNNVDSADFAVRALLYDEIQHLNDTTGLGTIAIDTTAGLIINAPYNYDSTNVIVLADTVGVIDTAYRSILMLKTSPTGLYNVAFDYLANGDYTNASATLSSIPSTYALNSVNTDAYNDINTLSGIFINQLQNGKTIGSIDTGSLTTVQNIAAKLSIAGSRAKNLLRTYYGKRYEDYPTLNYGSEDRAMLVPHTQQTSHQQSPNLVKVFPNPAGSYVTFAFQAPNNNNALNLT